MGAEDAKAEHMMETTFGTVDMKFGMGIEQQLPEYNRWRSTRTELLPWQPPADARSASMSDSYSRQLRYGRS